MSRNFDLSQAANDGVTVLPDLTSLTPAPGEVLTVASVVAGQVFTTFAPATSGAGAFLPLAGGTLTGPLLLAADPTVPLGAATKAYADAGNATQNTLIGQAQATADNAVKRIGDTMTGALVLPYDPTLPLQAATKQYVDTKVSSTPSGASLTVADTPPALTQGALWFDSISTQLYVGYLDPSGPPGQWVIANNSDLGGAYLPISGGTLTGALTLAGDPTAPLHAAPRRYIDNAINLAGNYLGTWQVAANSPNINAGGSISNANYVATTTNPATPETVPAGVPGIAGMTVANGDRIIWAAGLGVWQILRNAGVTLAAADARYVALTGSTMTGALTLPGNAASALQAVPLQQLPVASSTTPTMDGTATIGVGTTWARADHIHPTDTTRYAASNPSGYQTAAQVSTAVAPYANNVGRNLIHNPLFNVQQRGAGSWTASGYTADRWGVYLVLDTATVQMGAMSDTGRAQVNDEAATQYFGITVTGNAGATAQTAAYQPMEGVRRLAGKTVTLSFWANASVANLKIGASLDQNFGTGGSPSAAVSGVGQSVTTISGTWTRFSMTFAVPSASGKTLGSNGNDATALNLWFSAGASNAARSGNVGVQSGFFTIWGIQLEIGSVATPLDYGGTPQQQLAACQRFYQQMSLDWAGQVSSGVGYRTGGTISPPMRATPTVTLNNNQSTGFGAVTTAVTFGAQPSGQLLQASATASATGFAALSALFNLSADL